MTPKTTVEIADAYARRRPWIFAVAALAFLAIYGVMRPMLAMRTVHASVDWWAVNALILLVALATGGGLLNRRPVRQLVNDEVSRGNYQRSIVIAFWVVMALAMGFYLWPKAVSYTARDAIYVVVTAGVSVALLAFAYFERRATRDA